MVDVLPGGESCHSQAMAPKNTAETPKTLRPPAADFIAIPSAVANPLSILTHVPHPVGWYAISLNTINGLVELIVPMWRDAMCQRFGDGLGAGQHGGRRRNRRGDEEARPECAIADVAPSRGCGGTDGPDGGRLLRGSRGCSATRTGCAMMRAGPRPGSAPRRPVAPEHDGQKGCRPFRTRGGT